jgi:predicted HTH transcriptional regulator
LTSDDFNSHLNRGYETNGLEFKGPGSRTDKSFLGKVVRAILAMANRMDGGIVIIGVNETAGRPAAAGLTTEQAETWSKYDDVSSAVNEYASPSVRFELELVTFNGSSFAVIQVHEFLDQPILCCKEYYDAEKKIVTLRRGACYVRSQHKPESSEIPSHQELRDLLELAIDKGVSKFLRRAQKAGIFVPIDLPTALLDDEKLFSEQIEDLE